MPGPRIVHALTSSFHLPSGSHHLQAGSFHLLGEGREQSDEAGPRVAAGVAKVDDQGKVAVVDGDLGEANDASDALLGLLGKLQPGHYEGCVRCDGCFV